MTVKEKEKLLELFYKLKSAESNEEYTDILSSIDSYNVDRDEKEAELDVLKDDLKKLQGELDKFKTGVKVLDQMYDAIEKNNDLQYALGELTVNGAQVSKSLSRISKTDGEKDLVIKNRKEKIKSLESKIDKLIKSIEEAEYDKNISELESKKIEIEEVMSYLQAIYQNAMDESIRNEIPSELESRLMDLMGISVEQAKSLQGILQNEHEILVEYDENKRLREPRQIRSFSYTPIEPKEEKTSVSTIISDAKSATPIENTYEEENPSVDEPTIEEAKNLDDIFFPSPQKSREELLSYFEPTKKPTYTEPKIEETTINALDQLEKDAVKELSPISPELQAFNPQIQQEKKHMVGDELLEYGLWFSPEIEEFIKSETDVDGLFVNLAVCRNEGLDIKSYIGKLKLMFTEEDFIKTLLSMLSEDVEFEEKIKLLKQNGISVSDINSVIGNILYVTVEEINNNYFAATNKKDMTELLKKGNLAVIKAFAPGGN